LKSRSKQPRTSTLDPARVTSGLGKPHALARLLRSGQTCGVFEPARVICMECRRELAADSPELRIELTEDDEPLYYCLACWEREFGENEEDSAG
jgi:hypothetical protein